MKIKGKELKSRDVLFLLLAAVMIPSIPLAAAMPDPSISCNPGSIVENTQCNVTVGGADGSEHIVNQIRVYDSGALEPGDQSNACPLPGPGEVGISVPAAAGVWELQGDTSGVPVRAFLNDQDDSVFAAFGTPIGDSVILVGTTAGALVTNNGDNPQTMGSVSVNAKWQFITNNIVPNTAAPFLPFFYGLASCGLEDTAQAGEYDNVASFQIIAPVGGEILPINTVSLLIAGVSSSMTSLIVVAIVAASAITLMKFQVSRKI